MTGGTGRSSRYPPAAHGCSQPQQVQLRSEVTVLSEGAQQGQAGAADIHQLLMAAHSLSRYSFHLRLTIRSEDGERVERRDRQE